MGLHLENVSIARGRSRILEGVTGRLAEGQIVGLVGPNGTGKSTLINAIATLLPFSGIVRWRGEPVRLGEIGYMPQHSQVRADLTVVETLLLGRHERLGWRVDNGDVDAAIFVLEEFGIAHLHARQMNTLSGGQQQLVLLAQRLLREPKLLLLDEATSALDIRHQMQVFDRLRAYVERTGALVIIAIHDLNLAARHTNTIMLLDRGRAAGIGPFGSVLHEDMLRNVYGIDAEILVSRSGHTVILPLGAVEGRG